VMPVKDDTDDWRASQPTVAPYVSIVSLESDFVSTAMRSRPVNRPSSAASPPSPPSPSSPPR
jgi:hypothetical protein